MIDAGAPVPVHCRTVGVMMPGFRVAVVETYSPRAAIRSARAARSPWR